ncbi:DNA-3-methyladenine glycosylase [Pedobacter sp. SYSU D00535]|uniref:DNA-3-methyladenine glycosylase n=1 Tax=Pedobacter sp. SYSU D00535 TaxID=2810308 RepID=UPI001A965765|nr:DNA-3-methyladenine glycosylase [Pedobacter sp. SYSU D00535]
MKLAPSFYQRDDVVLIAEQLLGKYLFSKIDGSLTGGLIVETEAYKGPEDRGSHAFNHRRTPRNEAMYAEGGIVYMYVCYGIHDMLNIVTGPAESSHAVLIRAIEPTEGIETMRIRRGITTDDRKLCKGPGALAKALALNKNHNRLSLQGEVVWIEDRNIELEPEKVVATKRVGLNIDEPYISIPWRFYIKGSPYISRP